MYHFIVFQRNRNTILFERVSFFNTHLDKLFNKFNVILFNIKFFVRDVLENLLKHLQGGIFMLIKYIKNRSVIDDVRLTRLGRPDSRKI